LWLNDTIYISASNFELDSDGKISANEATISGSISASSGQIGGWSIGENNLSQDGAIELGSSSVTTSDIFIGSQDGYPYFQLGEELIYSNSALILTGSIYTNNGYFNG